MLFKPINPTTEQSGNIIRIHAVPKWIRPDGHIWYPISSFIATVNGGYDVLTPLGVASLHPAKRPAGARAKSVISGAQFGDEIVLSGVEDVIQYDAILPAGAVEVANGWECGSWDGVKLGLFFDDWRAKFGKRFSRIGNVLSLDLTIEKADAALGKTISLDPTIVPITSVGCFDNYADGVGSGWAVIRSGELDNINFMPADVILAYSLGEDAESWFSRVVTRFDITGYDAAINAVLHFYISLANVPHELSIIRYTSAADFEDVANYIAVYNALAGSNIGNVTGSVGWKSSPNLLTGGFYTPDAGTSYLHFAIVIDDDQSNNSPGDPDKQSIMSLAGANAPYLEIIMPAPVGTLAMMGCGR